MAVALIINFTYYVHIKEKKFLSLAEIIPNFSFFVKTYVFLVMRVKCKLL